MTPEPKAVLELAQRIVEAEQTLADLQQRWVALFAAHGGAEAGNRARGGSFASRVETFLSSRPDETSSIAAVASALSVEQLKAGRTLFRLASTGRIDSPSRGQYRAKFNANRLVQGEEEEARS